MGLWSNKEKPKKKMKKKVKRMSFIPYDLYEGDLILEDEDLDMETYYEKLCGSY